MSTRLTPQAATLIRTSFGPGRGWECPRFSIGPSCRGREIVRLAWDCPSPLTLEYEFAVAVEHAFAALVNAKESERETTVAVFVRFGRDANV